MLFIRQMVIFLLYWIITFKNTEIMIKNTLSLMCEVFEGITDLIFITVTGKKWSFIAPTAIDMQTLFYKCKQSIPPN